MIKIILRDIGKFLKAVGEVLLAVAILGWVISCGGLVLIPMAFTEPDVPSFVGWIAVGYSAVGWIIVLVDYIENLRSKVRDEQAILDE